MPRPGRGRGGAAMIAEDGHEELRHITHSRAGAMSLSLASAVTDQNWTATPRSWLIWLSGGGVTENRTPKSLNVKSAV